MPNGPLKTVGDHRSALHCTPTSLWKSPWLYGELLNRFFRLAAAPRSGFFHGALLTHRQAAVHKQQGTFNRISTSDLLIVSI
jgi:hypothetical protein